MIYLIYLFIQDIKKNMKNIWYINRRIKLYNLYENSTPVPSCHFAAEPANPAKSTPLDQHLLQMMGRLRGRFY